MKTLQWFSMFKSRAISVKGRECLEHLFEAKHMKMCYKLEILYINCL
jgi:hypothetical protein